MALPEAIASAAGETFASFTVLRELGSRRVKALLATGSSASGAENLVLERYGEGEGFDPAELDALAVTAKRLMQLRHPNLGLVRDVARSGKDVIVASEYAEGISFEELRKLSGAKGPVPLEIGLRVLVDVLSGLSSLHTAQGAPPLAHGEVSSIDVLVGQDGVTRLLRPYRGALVGSLVEADSLGYMAPELLKGKLADVASDVFGAGVLLWEILSRRRLFPKTTREAMASRTMKIPKPIPPADASWAAPLANVAERALSLDPAQRYGSAAEMAAALRLIVRSRLAMPPKVADLVERVAGDAIRERRAKDFPSDEAPTSTAGRKLRPSMPPQAVAALEAIRPSSRPAAMTPAPPAFVHEAPTIPRAPSLPKPTPATAEFDDAEPISLGGLLMRDEPPTAPRKSNRPVAPAFELTPAPARVAPAPPPVPKIAPPAPSTAPPLAAPPVAPPPVTAPPVAPPPVAAPPAVIHVPTPASAIMPTAPPAALLTPAASPMTSPEPVAARPPPPEPELATSIDEAPRERRNKALPIVLAVLGVCLLLGLVAGVRVLLKTPEEGTAATPSASSAPVRIAPLPPVSASAAAPEAATIAPPPTPSADPSAEASASATSPAPSTSGKKTPRPRPTYDPEGI